jgi:hypothetical protein
MPIGPDPRGATPALGDAEAWRLDIQTRWEISAQQTPPSWF